jgi:hypothetical protein
MDSFKSAVLKAVIHGVEVAGVAVVFVLIYSQVSTDPEVKQALKELLVAAIGIGATSVLPALVRKWGAVPMGDYVNDR